MTKLINTNELLKKVKAHKTKKIKFVFVMVSLI